MGQILQDQSFQTNRVSVVNMSSFFASLGKIQFLKMEQVCGDLQIRACPPENKITEAFSRPLASQPYLEITKDSPRDTKVSTKGVYTIGFLKEPKS